MAKNYLAQCLAWSVLFANGTAYALEVIYSSTDTVDAQPYYANIQIEAPEKRDMTLVEQLMKPDPKQKSAEIAAAWKQFSTDSNIYPVQHPMLSLGHVTAKTLPYELPPSSAMFVIGNDKMSLTWMRDNAAHLQQIKANGYLVSVEDKAQYQRIQDYAKKLGLNVVTYQGAFIFQQLKIEHYPVIIHRDKVYQ